MREYNERLMYTREAENGEKNVPKMLVPWNSIGDKFASYGAIWGIKEEEKKSLSASKCPHYCCYYSAKKKRTARN